MMSSESKVKRRRWRRCFLSLGCWREYVVKKWVSLGSMVGQYKQGAAMLFLDLRVAWRHRRLVDRRRLARRELLAVQNAVWDLVRVLPVLANPLPPPFGLSLVALAYQWPRWMLPPQFHSSDQRLAFARLDAGDQSKAARDINLEVSEDVKRRLLDLSDDAAPPPTEEDATTKHLRAASFIRDHFSDDDFAPLSLRTLSRRDLRRFLTLARPRLPYMDCCCCPPSFVARRIIARAAVDVDDDDALLLEPGRDVATIRDTVAGLSRPDLLDACVARALGDLDALPAPEDRLVEWLTRRNRIDQLWPHRHAPPALLFTLALLLHHNHPQKNIDDSRQNKTPKQTTTTNLVDSLLLEENNNSKTINTTTTTRRLENNTNSRQQGGQQIPQQGDTVLIIPGLLSSPSPTAAAAAARHNCKIVGAAQIV